MKTKTEDVEQGLMGKKVVSVFIHFWRRVKPAISALFWEALLPTPVSFISTRTLCPEELAVHQRDTGELWSMVVWILCGPLGASSWP